MKQQDILRAFAGKLVGNTTMKHHVAKVLSKMPDTIADYITQYCWFISSLDDAWAFTFTGNDLADQHLIFLGDDLLSQSEMQINYTIAHEIGHVILTHRNSVLVKQSKEEIDIQEQEAHEFAIEYFEAP